MSVYYKYWDNVYYLKKGQGPVLVLLHGYCDDHTVWSRVEEDLEQYFTLIIPDMPGFGQSEICQPQTIDNIAEKVKAILDAEKVEKAVIVGHSMGGYAALAFAEHYPDYLQGMGLFHSTAINDTEEKKINRDKTIEFVDNNGIEPFAKTFVPNLYAQGFNDDALIRESYNKALNCSKEAVIETAKALRDRPDRKHVLQQVSCPVMFIIGKHDAIIPYKSVLELTSLPQLGKVDILYKSGHLGMVEQPERSTKLLKEFTQFCFDRK